MKATKVTGAMSATVSPFEETQLRTAGKLWRITFIVTSRWTYHAKLEARYLLLRRP